MKRALVMFGLVASMAGLAALATSGAARAEGEWWEPKCDTYAYDPYTSNDVVAGFGRISCSAGGSDWAARWWIEVCLQKWVRPDDQFYDVVCTYDWTEGEERRIGANIIAPADCSVGYGEYRIIVHTQWFVDYWHNSWAISNVAWNCAGH